MKIIGHMYTDFPEKFGIPRQSGLVKNTQGTIIFEPEYRNPEAIRGLEEFSYIWIIWKFSLTERDEWTPLVRPPRLGGKEKRGVFATRSPYRPNPIGLSSVKIKCIDYDSKLGPVIKVLGADLVDGTPIYDIKPYLTYSDCHEEARGGFGAEVFEHSLNVIFPDEMAGVLSPKDRETVRELLAQDPRTAFIDDDQRVWGMTYKEYNIKFTVCGEELVVKAVENRAGKE